jgi:hypothetical protein
MHAVQTVMIDLTPEEILSNREKANLLCSQLIQMWANKQIWDIKTKKQIVLLRDDIDITVYTQRMALECQICGQIFESEEEAEDSPCPFTVDNIPESGIDSYFDITPVKGEVVNMYVYRSEVEALEWTGDDKMSLIWNDLSLCQVYLKPETTSNGVESEGYYAATDIDDAKAEPLTNRERKAPRERKPRREPKYDILRMLAKSKANELAELKRKKGRNDTLYYAYKAELEAEYMELIALKVLWLSRFGVEVL